jgi:hypothetical protein
MSHAGPLPQSENDLELQALRETNALKLIAADQEGVSLGQLPNGIYGYTYSPISEETPLFATKAFQSFEVHKLADGRVRVIGFVREQEQRSIAAGDEPVEFNLYPAPHGESNKIIAIEASRIARAKAPSRIDGNYMRIDLDPLP